MLCWRRIILFCLGLRCGSKRPLTDNHPVCAFRCFGISVQRPYHRLGFVLLDCIRNKNQSKNTIYKITDLKINHQITALATSYTIKSYYLILISTQKSHVEVYMALTPDGRPGILYKLSNLLFIFHSCYPRVFPAQLSIYFAGP